MLNKSKKYDAIIIGQGLAGSLLAWELMRCGQSVLVIDNAHSESSSMVAAGMINPITGHRLNLTENFDRYLQSAMPVYEDLEKQLGSKFISAIKQQRVIKNPGQAAYLKKRLKQEEYADYLELETAEDACFNNAEYGIVSVKNSYRVDAQKLLRAIASHLESMECLAHEKVDYADIKTTEASVYVGGHEAEKLFFCEGFQAIHNPWLKDLPFKLAKGEVLTVEHDKPVEGMLNWGSWLLPISSDQKNVSQNGQQNAYLGASYEWNDTSTSTTEEAADKLLDSLHEHTSINGAVVDHKAGIRPTTQDRQFFIGKVKELPNAYCFNGFGSKGCLTIPYFTKIISEHVTTGEPLSALCT